jgi:D-alanyl-D-alanine carboxypeptidase
MASTASKISRRSFMMFTMAAAAQAAKRRRAVVAHAKSQPSSHASLVMDGEGCVIIDHNGESRWPPASMTKLMTLYLAMEKMKAGELYLTDEIKISAHAAGQLKTKLYLKKDHFITVEDTMRGIIVHSANDAAVALAEEVYGSEEAFVDQMNAKAKSLGMTDTNFCNASGLPANGQLTTAYDIAVLMNAIHNDFPEYQDLFKIPSFHFGRSTIHRTDRDIMYPGLRYKSLSDVVIEADKTGTTNASKYNIVASVSHKGTRIVAVVMGAPSGSTRRLILKQLIESGYAALETRPSYPLQGPPRGAPLESRAVQNAHLPI